MSSLVRLSLVIFLTGLLFTHCSKNDDFTGNYLKGKIDGVNFECTSNIHVNKPEPIPSQGDDPTIRITGDWQGGYSLKLVITGEGSSITAHTYTFESGKMRNATVFENNTNTYYAGNGGLFDPLLGSGSITILEISKKYVRGNFSFVTDPNASTVATVKTITEGTFYVKRE